MYCEKMVMIMTETSECQCQYHHLPADFEKDNDLMYQYLPNLYNGVNFILS